MSDVTELIAAIAAIAKDPKAWEARLGNADDIATKLADIRKVKTEADAAAKAAAKDLETARYERGQAEHASRDAAAQASANVRRQAELDAREKTIAEREAKHEQDKAGWNANVVRREAELDQRERAAAAKLNEASKLMASYDEAKHKAALKLAS